MEQMQPGDQLRSAGGGAMSKAASAKDRVDSALSRLESMVDERLRAESSRADEMAKRLSKLERQHDELKKVAMDVEGRLERAMEYILSHSGVWVTTGEKIANWYNENQLPATLAHLAAREAANG